MQINQNTQQMVILHKYSSIHVKETSAKNITS